MSGRATYCEVCQSVSHAIDFFYQSMKESSIKGTLDNGKWLPKNFQGQQRLALGSLENLKSRSSCTSCQDIFEKIVRDGAQLSSHSEFHFVSDFHGLYIRQRELAQPSKEYLELRHREAFRLAYETGRIFDSQQADITLLRKWIDCCQVSHGSRCLSSQLRPPSHHIYLVDVHSSCLVDMSAESRYIALSYVWGNITTAQTTKSNLMHLKTPGSIMADGGDLAIPNTIRDALRLVSLLGERYLWVDIFCIVQDDEEMKQFYINSMASIYANAYTTIIAADGKDANHGLRGIGGGAKPRNIDCGIIRFQNGNEMIAHRPSVWDPEDTTWGSRGWTFQEGLFSRRILVFSGLVSWVCRSAIWEEQINSPTEDVAYAIRHRQTPHQLRIAAQAPTWPDLEGWAGHVREFNHRKLAFDKDVVNAFSGATSVFNSLFSGGILWGIPEMFFDYCIIWQPRAALRQRRVHCAAHSAVTIPSWSWVAWEGAINLVGAWPMLEEGPETDDQCIELQPMVEWYKSRTLTSSLYPVKNTYHSLLRTHRNSESDEIPTGWTRNTYPEGTPYYTHGTAPSVRFRCPLPLVNDDIESLPDNENQYLSFRALRTRFYLGQNTPRDSIHKGFTCCPVSLTDYRGSWAGVLVLGTLPSNRPPVGELCELIGLSLGTAVEGGDYRGLLDEWEMPERPRDSEFYRFYNVMCIEWENGIAYRRAVGTVYKDMWESQNLEKITVVLG